MSPAVACQSNSSTLSSDGEVQQDLPLAANGVIGNITWSPFLQTSAVKHVLVGHGMGVRSLWTVDPSVPES